MRVIIDASDVIKSFEHLRLRKQEDVLRKAYYEGGRIIARGAAYGLLRTLRGNANSHKVRDMVNSIGYKYNKRGQFLSIYPIESTDTYFSYMTKWFIAGTKVRKSYNLSSRTRKSTGLQTMRRYKSSTRRSYGRIAGNDAVVRSYNANYQMANILIHNSIEKQLIKIWKNGRKSTVG